MDQRVKLLAAGSVLLIGLLLAALFRREGPSSEPPPVGNNERLELGRGCSPLGAAETATAAQSGGSPVILPPASAGRALADPSHAAVSPTPPPTARWDPGRMAAEPLPKVPPARTHRVVDGDSLRSLAERYLGSADRWAEIFQANRDVLANPAILPIGTALKIVARPPEEAESDLLPRGPLVPVGPKRD
jgi:nucleoid-associated protein YgaU